MSAETDLEYGMVKVFNPLKGFGFIQRQKGKDVFVMFGDIIDDDSAFLEGAHVSFNIENTEKGPKAKNVRVVG